MQTSPSALSNPRTIDLPAKFQPLFKPARYKGFYGGRGGAKSHAFATALTILGAQKPLRILCAREIQKSIEDSVKRLLDDKIASCGLGGFYQSIKTDIVGANGTLFRFAGLRTNVDSIKSFEGIDIVWIEEANTVSQNSLDTLIPTIRKPSSEIWASWNPKSPKDPVDHLFRGNNPELKDKWSPPPNSIIERVSFEDNPWFPEVLREEMEWDKRRDPNKYAHIWLGEYQRRSEACVFQNWKIDALQLPNGVTPRYGADWGFSIDPSVLIRCYIWDRTLYIEREIYKIGCEIDRTPALFDTMDNGAARRWQITADSARPETISYMRRHGYPKIVAAKKGPGSIEDGLEFMKSYDIVVHPSCKHTIDELSTYSYKVDKQTNEILPELEDKKNHVIDACRYAVEGLRRAAPKASFGHYRVAH